MVDYPVDFESQCSLTEEKENLVLETDEGLETEMSVPKEFGGSDSMPSPETLYSASLHTCLVATFRTIAGRKSLEYERIDSECKVSLDRGDDSRPVMKKAEIKLKVEGVKDTEKAREVRDMATKNCFIHNSVDTDVRTEFRFEE